MEECLCYQIGLKLPAHAGTACSQEPGPEPPLCSGWGMDISSWCVENESAGVCCHSDVGSEGQLVIQCHTQVPCSLSRRDHRVLFVNGKVMDVRGLPWEKEQLSHFKIELHVVCRYPQRDFSQTWRDLCCHVGFRPGKNRVSFYISMVTMAHAEGAARSSLFLIVIFSYYWSMYYLWDKYTQQCWKRKNEMLRSQDGFPTTSSNQPARPAWPNTPASCVRPITRGTSARIRDRAN